MDNANNTEVMGELNETVIVMESGADKPYKVEDADIEFDVTISDDGELILRPERYEDDILYDEIGSVLKVKQLQEEKKELFEQLEQYFEAFF